MSDNLKKIIPMAALSVMGLFGLNKGATAQAERSIINTSMKHNMATVKSELAPGLVIVSDESLNPENSSSSTGMGVEITVMGDTLIVDDASKVDWLKKNPTAMKQINFAMQTIENFPEGSLATFEVSTDAEREEMEIAQYSQQASKKTAYFNGTPIENFRKIGYDISGFENQIKTNNWHSTKGEKYSQEDVAEIYQDKVKFDKNFKPTGP